MGTCCNFLQIEDVTKPHNFTTSGGLVCNMGGNITGLPIPGTYTYTITTTGYPANSEPEFENKLFFVAVIYHPVELESLAVGGDKFSKPHIVIGPEWVLAKDGYDIEFNLIRRLDEEYVERKDRLEFKIVEIE